MLLLIALFNNKYELMHPHKEIISTYYFYNIITGMTIISAHAKTITKAYCN